MEPATKQDLEEMRQQLTATLNAGFAAQAAVLTAAMDALEKRVLDRAQEMVRDAQTELLRGYEKVDKARSIQMRKIEANLSNLDVSVSTRMAIIEERVNALEIEMVRLRGPRPNDKPEP